MSGQMEYSYFPVKLRDLRSRIHFSELEEGFFRVGDVLVETQYLNHTAPTIAYRMTQRRRHRRLRHRPRAVLEGGRRDPAPSGRSAAHRVPARRRPGHSRRAVHRRAVHEPAGLGPLDDRVRHRRRAGRRRQAAGPLPPRPHPRRRHDGPHGGRRASARGRVGQRARRVRGARGPGGPHHRRQRARRRCPRSRRCAAG